MDKVYRYVITEFKAPTDVILQEYGGFYKYTPVDLKSYRTEYKHKISLGAFIIDTPTFSKGKNVKDVRKVTITSIENLGNEVDCYYEIVPSSSLWWMSGYDHHQVINSIMAAPVHPSNLDHFLGVAKLLIDEK